MNLTEFFDLADIRPNVGLGNAIGGYAIIRSMRYAQEVRHSFRAILI